MTTRHPVRHRSNQQEPIEPYTTKYAEARERLQAKKEAKIQHICKTTGMAYEGAKRIVEQNRQRGRYLPS